MYAARRTYVKQWDHQSPDERYTVKVARGGKSVAGIQDERIAAVEEEVMYWRKANHIHGWFVNNVQDEEDDCRSYYVDWGQLEDLLGSCEKVMAASKLVDGLVYESTVYDQEHPDGAVMRAPGKLIEDATVAKELLPATEGFFFGTTEYDESYFDDVRDTRDWIVRMLADKKAGVPGDIYYSSSW